MKRYFSSPLATVFFLAVLALALTSCGDSPERGKHGFIQGSENSDSYPFALSGSITLLDSLVPVSLEIVSVNENLDSLQSVRAVVYKTTNGFVYVSDSADYPSPLLRLSYTCMRRDSSVKMEFSQYVDYNKTEHPQLNILGALESERVEYLVRNDGFYLELAKQKADREIRELLDFRNKVKYPLEYDSTPSPLHLLLYLYCDISATDSAFYANFTRMRSALGENIEYEEILPSTKSIDSAFTLFGNYRDIKKNRISIDEFLAAMQFWAQSYKLPACDSNSIGDTVSNKNSESAYSSEQFICFYNADSIPMWRMVSHLERGMGICDTAITGVFDSLVYRCDPRNSEWVRLNDIEAVTYLYGTCDSNNLGTKIYDTTVVSCVQEDSRYKWINGTPKEEKEIYSIADELVKDKEGECNDERDREMVKVGDAFYQCDSLHWVTIDEQTYTFGDCTQERNGKYIHDKKFGTFVCIQQGTMDKNYVVTWTHKWVESVLPYYYGDKCDKAKNQNEIKFYEDNYFVCDNSKWRVMADSEITAPVLEKDFCDSSKLHTFKTFGESLFVCEDMQWRAPNKSELMVKEVIERNKFDKHYCDSGVAGTTLFWDSTSSNLYGCGPNHLYRKADGTYGWKLVASIIGHNGNGGVVYNGDGPVFSGGKFTDASTYELDYKKMHLAFKLGTSYEMQNELVDGILTVGGISYVWRYSNRRFFVRDSMGNKTVRLDTLEGKSESLEGFYKNWVAHIGDEQVGDSLKTAVIANFNTSAHKTLQQAMDLCPEGFRLPDSTEWRTIVPKVREMESFVASSGYGASRRYNLFWTSSEKDSETQYCYEYVLKQNSDISYYWDILAGDLIECPKDLYPMVQALCISEEE